ncbi:MAG TPA: type I-C CRISPR-associated protein Cas8c/Csd1 [Sedimentisphaerales bacterium]|nr:type I-C CRISPR-associated protein Cas8c/Csd1 [Sedimentisphaerales bacterium]
MILQSLACYYDRIVESGDDAIAGDGFSCERIHFALVLDCTGKLVQVLDLRDVQDKRATPRNLIVPQGPKKSVNIAASFLWGSPGYVLGADGKGKPERTLKCHDAFKELHRQVLATCDDEAAKAVIGFLVSWKPENTPELPDWPDMLKANLVFKIDGDHGFIHDRPQIRKLWLDRFAAGGHEQNGMCLVSGEMGPIAVLHPAIKGVRGAQSSGAALVSFNLDAFCSYGKAQNLNAPVCEFRANAYTKALNHLLSSGSNRVQIGDATTVFWTERQSPVEGFFGMILDPRDSAGDDRELAVFLEAVREGKLPRDIEGDVKFYVLGLSPNAARLSVRFWHVSTVEEVSDRLGQHFRDLAMVRSFESDPPYPGMWHLLRETANRKSDDGPPPLLAGAVMRSILTGTLYPQTLLSAVIGRIRADQNINYLRTAIIKAVLARRQRILNQGIEVSMALDTENRNVAYLLGRLFAVLEKAQQGAIPGANTTIKDRFYGSASATPRVVFPQLLRLAQHHIQKDDYGRVRDKQIEEILGNLQEFPAHMGLDEQGLFAIGYYHQRQSFFTKKDNQ